MQQHFGPVYVQHRHRPRAVDRGDGGALEGHGAPDVRRRLRELHLVDDGDHGHHAGDVGDHHLQLHGEGDAGVPRDAPHLVDAFVAGGGKSQGTLSARRRPASAFWRELMATQR